MSIVRLDAASRRQAIVDAALPLFARKGFARTTSKEIAEAARVSEALVFKHFPSKAALYEEIMRLGCADDPAWAWLESLPASTASLVAMIRFMLAHLVLAAGIDAAEHETRTRLVVMSHLEDGEYARVLFATVFAHAYPKFAACLAAASAAGDLVPGPVSWPNRFWFGHHVAAMLAQVRLPGAGAAGPAPVDDDGLVDQAAWFILRGMGLADAALTRHSATPCPTLEEAVP